ncbi:MAG: ATP-binding protein [Candidatus Omnitrophica bacterium]|nr:ATP-binding protein [Candidatus Omnitrophota bacterium]MDD5501164.1 ATP-binding protein [Candidatus Omnitrophota bacterium]
MKKITIISGKGGTGKTVVSASFAALARNKIMVDCDVDAADLHLILHPRVRERHEFSGGSSAAVDKGICVRCGKCLSVCRFSAVSPDFDIEGFSCEGCGLCARLCPSGAIRMVKNVSGEWFVSDTAYGPLVHARLGAAEENSGKLVSKIRERAEEMAQKEGFDYVIADGPPGIGCPVIASLSGADLALIVTEPTLSGLHDAARVIKTAKQLKVPLRLAVNKYDLNPSMSEEIERYCSGESVPLCAKIPFDRRVVESVLEGKPAAELTGCAAAEEIRRIWHELETTLRGG